MIGPAGFMQAPSKNNGNGTNDHHKENIVCPRCESEQFASVKHTYPWDTYIHECNECSYLIMESEWNRVKEQP